jgi:hypothetical protein
MSSDAPPPTLGGRQRALEGVGAPVSIEYGGYRCDAYPQYYADALDRPEYAGGNAPSSLWLTRTDILSFLDHIGFTSIETDDEVTVHPSGPYFSIAAQCS